MCNVCLADEALATSRCGKKSCRAFNEGLRVEWRSGPLIRQEVPRHLSKLMNNVDRVFFPEVFVRARGRGAEFKPAEFQIRRSWECWNGKWYKSKDLAGSLGTLGLDTVWDCMPPMMKDYVLGRRKQPPSRIEVRRYNAAYRREFDAAVDRLLCDECKSRRKVKVLVDPDPESGDVAGPTKEPPKPFCRKCERALRKAARERERKDRTAHPEGRELRLRIEYLDDKRLKVTKVYDPVRREEWVVARERTRRIVTKAEKKLLAVVNNPKVTKAITWVKKLGKGKAQVMMSAKTREGSRGGPL